MQGRRETTAIGTRYLAALGVSLGCHATLLFALTLLSVRIVPLEQPLVVAVMDGGGANGGEAGASGDVDRGDAGRITSDAAHSAGDVQAAARAHDDLPSVPPAVHDDGPAAHDVAAARPAPAATARDADRRRPAQAQVASAARASRARHDADPVRDTAPSRYVDSAAREASPANDATEDRAARGANRAAAGVGDGAVGVASAAGVGVDGSAAFGVGRAGAAGDLRPWCSLCPIPVYPARARREGWQGTVDVELRVGRDGGVEQASIGRSSGFAVLDSAAVTVARRSRFRVADGAERRGQLRYRFVLEGLADRPL